MPFLLLLWARYCHLFLGLLYWYLLSNLALMSTTWPIINRFLTYLFYRRWLNKCVDILRLIPCNPSITYSLESFTRQSLSSNSFMLTLLIDLGHVTFLALLSASAAFDTVDHGILLECLQNIVSCRGSPVVIAAFIPLWAHSGSHIRFHTVWLKSLKVPF